MSWSINLIGNPENVVKALEHHSTVIDGQSKEEFDSALPHFIGLLKQNYGSYPVTINFQASGHGYDASEPFRQCQVKMELLYGILV